MLGERIHQFAFGTDLPDGFILCQIFAVIGMNPSRKCQRCHFITSCHSFLLCAECEPYLTSDYRRMLEEPEKLIKGLKVSLSLFPKVHIIDNAARIGRQLGRIDFPSRRGKDKGR